MSRSKRNTTSSNVKEVTSNVVVNNRKRSNDESAPIFQMKFVQNTLFCKMFSDDVDDDGFVRIINIQDAPNKINIKKKVNKVEKTFLVSAYDALNEDDEYLTDAPMESRQKVAFHALVNETRRETKRTIDPSSTERVTRAKLDETETMLAIMTSVSMRDFTDVTTEMYESVKTKIDALIERQSQDVQSAFYDHLYFLEMNESDDDGDDDDDDVSDDDDDDDDTETETTQTQTQSDDDGDASDDGDDDESDDDDDGDDDTEQ